MSLNACMSEKKQPSRTTTLKRYKSYSTRGEFCASRYRPVYGSTLIQIPNKSKGLERGKKEGKKKKRPETRQPQSRVGGQGLYLRSLDHLGRSSEAKDRKNPNKATVESRSTRLKRNLGKI